MQLSYARYLDQVYGGWIGKSMGGAVGARFEGTKEWIDLAPEEMFPGTIPPNDDLDMCVLWLSVLEEKGISLKADDLAAAWLRHCWYPFNEFGIFRRNWRLGIHPPLSGQFNNQFWETGMGCPMRAEIWGYVFPGAPDLAASFAKLDGSLDHGNQSTGGEMMLAAMSALAFFTPDVHRLIDQCIHFLPPETTVSRLAVKAIQAFEESLSLQDARQRLLVFEGNPETSDAQTNIPFVLLALLYGQNDLEKTMLSALSCGYDTDTTGASAGALIGQILGASHIPQHLKDRIGDELVMGIDYRREEMTLSALARDTVLTGIHLAEQSRSGIQITAKPIQKIFTYQRTSPPIEFSIHFDGLPCVMPGETKGFTIEAEGPIPADSRMKIQASSGWMVVPEEVSINLIEPGARFFACPSQEVDLWSMQHRFTALLSSQELVEPVQYNFGIAGAGIWQFLGIYFDTLPEKGIKVHPDKIFRQHFVSLEKNYIPEPDLDVAGLNLTWGRILGRQAFIPSYEMEIDLEPLVGLKGSYCAYLARTIHCPDNRLAYIVVGNTDSYRLYFNGEMIAEIEECVAWSPYNNVHEVQFQPGKNQLLLKLLKRTDYMRFTLGFRHRSENDHGQNTQDWMIDLADVIPHV